MTDYDYTVNRILGTEFFDGGGDLRCVSEFMTYDEAYNLLEEGVSEEDVIAEGESRESWEGM